MTSTRNNNMKGNYCLQQRAYDKTNVYRLNKSKRIAHYSTLPCAGINVGQIPNTVLAKNATDIESSLFGINSSNLVSPAPPILPNLNYLSSLSFFSRLKPYLPEPLVIEHDQRPQIFRK